MPVWERWPVWRRRGLALAVLGTGLGVLLLVGAAYMLARLLIIVLLVLAAFYVFNRARDTEPPR